MVLKFARVTIQDFQSSWLSNLQEALVKFETLILAIKKGDTGVMHS